ncbi:hypothetical protein PQR05_37810 [Paraburkholderia sediminicola]|uniref:PD(D/E)XK endonuclease domain-containing protein n=1 Tax=Paraburkholderia metrosideri TaxID=580937 RepID=A0ABW9E4S0_9BURK
MDIATDTGKSFKNSMTGNAGLNYAAWQLSRRGWHVMPTVRNIRGSDLIVTDAEETQFFGVQSKALSKRNAVPLGKSLDSLRSTWWVITVHANADHPICYVLARDEVKRLSTQDANGGAYWLSASAYDRDEFREAWDRIGMAPDEANE